jgi:hypothetical protein
LTGLQRSGFVENREVVKIALAHMHFHVYVVVIEADTVDWVQWVALKGKTFLILAFE